MGNKIFGKSKRSLLLPAACGRLESRGVAFPIPESVEGQVGWTP